MKKSLPSLCGLAVSAAGLGIFLAFGQPPATAQLPTQPGPQAGAAPPNAPPVAGNAPASRPRPQPLGAQRAAGQGTPKQRGPMEANPAQASSQPRYAGPPPASTAVPANDPRMANRAAGPRATEVSMLLESAIAQLDSQISITARMRQQIQLLGYQLRGVGTYEQAGRRDQRRFRLELKIPIGEEMTSFARIQTSKYLWICEEIPDRTTLSQIDVDIVRQALANRRGPSRVGAGSPLVMPLEGLPKLLANLHASFQFGPPRQGNLDQLSVFQLQGTWKPAALAEVAGDQKDKILAGESPNWNSIAAQLPDRVILTLGSDDLFPYRIEYLRQPPVKKGEPADGSPSLATLELFEVRLGGQIAPDRFVYQPGDRPFTSGTEAYLKTLGINEMPAMPAGPQSRLPEASPQR